MMYSEFIAGTGCKENEHNYKVFCNLEAMYMNTDMSKAEIYEYGKKLVDNSKSERELRFEAKIKAEIKSWKERIEVNNWWLDYYKQMGDNNMIKYYREENKSARNAIASLKWILED